MRRAVSLARGASLALTLTIVAAFLSGCSASIAAETTVSADGSGDLRIEVAVDRETDRVLRSLTGLSFSNLVTLSDVIDAGWGVDRSASDSGSMVTLHRQFSTPAEFGALISEIGGSGPAIFQNPKLSVEKKAVTREYFFECTVDLSSSQISGALESSFGKEAVGVLRAKYDFDPSRDISLRFVLHLPGRAKSTNADSVSGGDVVWQVKAGQTLAMSATSSYFELPYVTAAAIGATATIALGALLVSDVIRRRRRSHVAEGAEEAIS